MYLKESPLLCAMIDFFGIYGNYRKLKRSSHDSAEHCVHTKRNTKTFCLLCMHAFNETYYISEPSAHFQCGLLRKYSTYYSISQF